MCGVVEISAGMLSFIRLINSASPGFCGVLYDFIAERYQSKGSAFGLMMLTQS